MKVKHFSLPILALLLLSVYFGASFVSVNNSSAVSGGAAIYGGSAYSSNISELVNSYIAPRFNANIDLVAQGLPNDTQKLGDLGQIYFENGSETYNSSENVRFEVDCCSWKAGWGLIDNPPTGDSQMGYQILQAMSNLGGTLGWVPNWVDDSVFGVPIPYRVNNTAIAFTLSNGSYPELPNGTPYQVAQNSPYNLTCHCWLSPDMNVNHGLSSTTKNNGSAETALYQSLNFFIRGNTADALTDFNWVAGTWNGTGFLDNNSLKNGFFRGEDLALFLYVQKVLNTSSSANLTQIQQKLWSLQNPDGGIAKNYTSTSKSNSDLETSEAALLPYSPTLISYVQQIASSGEYSLTSVPSLSPTIYPAILSDPTVTVTSTMTTTLTSVSTDIVPTTTTVYSTQTSTVTDTSTRTSTETSTQISTTTLTLSPSTSTVTDVSISTKTTTSTATATVTSTLTRDSTVISLSCTSFKTAGSSKTSTCSAQVTDDSPSPSTPSNNPSSVTLSTTGPGSFGTLSCSTSSSTLSLTCKSTLTVPSSSTATETLSVTYHGDSSHDASFLSLKLKV